MQTQLQTLSLGKVLRTNKAHLNSLGELGVRTAHDLLFFFPRTYEDKRIFSKVGDIRTDQSNNIKGILTNINHKRSGNGKLLTRAILSDDSGSIEVIWFNQPFLKRILHNGQEIILSGKARFAFGKTTLQNPIYEEIKQEQAHVGRIVPVYHQTEGITSKWIREKLQPLIDEWVSHLEDLIPPEIIKSYGLMNFKNAVKEAHFPTNEKKLEQSKHRLAFDELFLLQLKALQKKWLWQNISEHEHKTMDIHPELGNLIKGLPFTLTKAQRISLKEILDDLDKPYPMSRLMQGDVGSGKTIVAGAALFNAIKHGYQTALMAPTEILAKQHFNTLNKLFKDYNFNIQFVSGSSTEKQKQEVLEKLRNGNIQLIIGTHSLIQENVNFKNLGLAVVDEQHRFGVRQRDILKKNGTPHLLSLSATPIPRTLAMTIYGDQDLSIIDEMPAGRQTIITRIVGEEKRIDAYRWIEDQINKGRQAFVICPLIDESDVLEVKSAIKEYEFLSEHIFPDFKIGLLHGKMKASDKEMIMSNFSNNKIQILVSTSVIEVGIDVPNATIMIIEGAERFGLSQLHQFRGRVGRGEHQSYCFLFTQSNSEESKNRLNAMVRHSSGFKLSEIDLNLRGPGEIYGVKQSGIPDLKMASLTDSQTIKIAREAAVKIINEDPLLEKYPQLRNNLSESQDVYIND
jgi:ATP-dependent DNA helicase RecG